MSLTLGYPGLCRKIFSAFLIVICSLHIDAQNPIVTENALPGNPASEWDITGAGDMTIQGYATSISVNKGNTIDFKINVTDGANYEVRIYRLGYYNGDGARLITNLGNYTGTIQPSALSDASTGLVDCGNWSVSVSWAVPANAVPGIYIARLTRTDNQGASHIAFVVRDDNSTADLLFKTSDATWQAYNVYGGNSLYVGSTSYPGGHAVKVSYNRPFITRNGGGGGSSSEDWLFHAEYPMIRWLEKNGYNLNYTTDVDVARTPALMQNHKAFLSVGHDEYWSKEERDNILAARNSGKHLAFFSGNEVYWKTRWENSIDGSNSPYRTLVCYKEGTMGENACGSKCDPSPVWTGLWRDGCSPPYAPNDGCLPENQFTGQISWLGATGAIQVPYAQKDLRFWRNTSITALTEGQVATLSDNTLGYELDWEQANGKYPSGRILLSSSNISGKTHKLSLYKHSSGAWVFGAGTVQWSWGLDGVHDGGSSVEDIRMQQATVNLFADMTVQPGSLQSGLVAATASTDITAPVSTITTPVHNSNIFSGLPLTITGTSTDANTVAGVEISVDGGTTWQAANGTNFWSYTFTPTVTGPLTIKCRSFDDSGNMETPGNVPSSSAILVTVINTPDPSEGPGGPILVISKSTNPFSRYPVEILRSEGLNEFSALDISAVNSTVLNNYDVAVLGEMSLSSAEVTMLSNWVNDGGTLIAMKPDAQLASLLGITGTGNILSDKYLLVNTASDPGIGILNQTMQFHGTADLYNLNGATSLATLYSDAATATSYPAVTSKLAGANGGSAVAFMYDLAKSVIYTRQGNPAWSADERDGTAPIRSNDLFYGNKAGDPQPDWIDFNKIAIPQADEQMRLLTNIIINNNLHKKPLPRFWFLPKGLKAAVVMTGDDHATNGTTDRFNQYLALSPSNTPDAVADWTAIRGSSYIYPNTPMSAAQAATFEGQGFEIALHVNTGCNNWTAPSLQNDIVSQSADLAAAFPGISVSTTNRTHCIAWSDWATEAVVEAANGIRLDVNYYYWPAAWILDRPGMFTGSGMPMRFANLNGSLIDCYQVTTQMTDESGISYSNFCNSLLDKATGPEGYYGVFCANMHTDAGTSAGSDAIIASAIAHEVPVISARQMLNWLDGRNNSSFSSLAWSGNQLTFSIVNNAGQQKLKAMIPVQSSAGSLASITRNGNPVTYSTQTIKGILYAFIDAANGDYIANYATCNPPVATITATTPVCKGGSVNLTLQSATGQAPYSLIVNGASYSNINVGQIFATINTAEVSIWGNTGSPANPSVTDNQPIEIGTKFRSSSSGYISGIRFYKGLTNTGTHIASLWTAGGTQLATATFTSESASGWQEVRFASPVFIQANTTYIASYFSQNGYFAFSPGFFLNSGVTNGPLTALQAGIDGPNGVYKYGGGFPDGGNTANYWVDVLFSEVSPNETSLSYVLTSIIDANNCSNTGGNLSTTNVTINPLPAGTLSQLANNCSNQSINLRFTSSSGTGPFSLVINGTTYNNVVSGVPFNTGILAPANTTATIWSNSTVGGDPAALDNSAVELGVKFRSSVAGTITGIRFYKRVQQPNGATYTGRLWSANGTLLATCTFTNISNSGWQQANFASPVTIDSNTTYIASYHAPNGDYAFTEYGLSNAVVNPPLTALQTGTDGPNGLYKYGNGGVFPNESYHDANYWVDVVFNGAGSTIFNLTGISDANTCSVSGALQSLVVLSNACAPLPVTLMNLSASAHDKNITLKWSTASETDNRGFEIYRSTDGINWNYIGFVNGAGNSQSVLNYSFVDGNLTPRRYYYRLKQVDLNAQYKFSNIVAVTLRSKDAYLLEQNHPNPFHSSTSIEFSIPVTQQVKITITDMQGRVIKTLLNETKKAGTYSIELNKNELSAGIFFYTMQTGYFTSTKKMIVQ